MQVRYAVGAALCAVLVLPRPAAALPHLLMSYPTDRGAYAFIAVSPITLVFSEPMDPASIVFPNARNTNPDRSFEVDAQEGFMTVPLAFTGGQPTSTDGGRIIEIPGMSSQDVHEPNILHLFRGGFRSLKGEPLDRDYVITWFFCDGCHGFPQPDDMLRASVPANGQAQADPAAPLSIYFGTPVDPTTFQALLSSGPFGPFITPLALHWDLPAQSLSGAQGFEHLTVDHPPLTPSARPYQFVVNQVLSPPGMPGVPVLLPYYLPPPYSYPTFSERFTVGPALAGDLNGNGVVDVGDAVLALRAALHFVTLTDAQRFAADVWPRLTSKPGRIGDGVVDISDVIYILQRAVGLVPDDQWP